MGKKRWSVGTVASLGGIARREKLTPEQRSELARRAVLARYKRATKEQRQAAALHAIRARWLKGKTRKRRTRRKPRQA